MSKSFCILSFSDNNRLYIVKQNILFCQRLIHTPSPIHKKASPLENLEGDVLEAGRVIFSGPYLFQGSGGIPLN